MHIHLKSPSQGYAIINSSSEPAMVYRLTPLSGVSEVFLISPAYALAKHPGDASHRCGQKQPRSAGDLDLPCGPGVNRPTIGQRHRLPLLMPILIGQVCLTSSCEVSFIRYTWRRAAYPTHVLHPAQTLSPRPPLSTVRRGCYSVATGFISAGLFFQPAPGRPSAMCTIPEGISGLLHEAHYE